MPETNSEVTRLVKEIADEVDAIKARVHKGEISQDESWEKVKKWAEDYWEEQRKELRRQQIPQNVVLHDKEMDSIRKGGLFGGEVQIPYAKMLELSPNDPSVKGTASEEQLHHAHVLNDACVFKYWHFRRKHGWDHMTTLRRLAERDPDMKGYLSALNRMGYIQGQKANEVVHPDNTDAGYQHLTFELLSADIIERVRLQSMMANRVTQRRLPRPQVKWNVRTNELIAVRGGVASGSGNQITPVGTDHPAAHIPESRYFQRPTFNPVQFDANHVMCFIEWDDDMMDESIVPLVPIFRQDLVLALSRGLERFILDGDAGLAADHMDLDVSTDTSFENIHIATHANGLRYLTNGAATADPPTGASIVATNAYTEADHVEALNQLHRFAGIPSQLTLALPMKAYHNMLLQGTVLTMEKLGPQATIKTGTLGTFMGVEIILPEFMSRYDLTAAGVAQAGGALSWGCLYREDRFWLGQYGTPKIETTRNAPLLHTVLQVDTRYDFKAVDTDLLNTQTLKFDTGKDGYPAVGIYGLDPTLTEA